MTFHRAFFSFTRALALLAVATAVNAAETYVGVFFDPTSINAGGTATFSMQLRENDGTAFSNGAITVNYPAGLVNDGTFGDPLITEDCTPHGAIITRTAGTNQLIVTNVTLAAFTFCDIYVRVTASAFGSYTIQIDPGSFSSSSPPTTNIQTTATTLNVVGPVFVTNTADSGTGSLRDAIDTVNSNCGTASAINFNIPGTGPFTISPTSALPAIFCGVVIDGYSQPGSAANSNPTGANNASIMIDLNGSACGACNGLELLGSGIQVDGLAIRSFAGVGIVSNPEGGGNTILGNYIGTDPGGMVPFGNFSGIEVDSGYGAIGDGSPGGRNLITANGGTGVLAVSGSVGVGSNQIGGLRDASPGSPNVGNGFNGIILRGANYQSNVITGNLILANTGAGVSVEPSTFARVVIEDNESYGNTSLGIDQLADGISNLNDEVAPYDTDGLQNYPVITSVFQSGGNTIVSGYLKSLATGSASVFLYHNSNPSGPTEGERFIDTFTLALDANGDGAFTRTIAGTWSNVSAQVTLTVSSCSDCLSTIRSSEYSPKVAVSNPLVVTTPNDSGAGSLRAAMDFVNANCTAADVITFNVPGGTANISVTTPLPTITCDNLVIDAFTQPGSSPNTLANGDNAVRGVILAGFFTSFGNGFTISARSVTIRGFEIWLFRFGAGVYVSTPLGLPGPNIMGNMIGIDDFNGLETNQVGIQVAPGASGVTVGTASNGDRNIISGNRAEGILLQSGDNHITNNYIGINRLGNGAVPVPNAVGISITGTTDTQIIGNLISGNTGEGILVGDSAGTGIQGNRIGVNNAGASAANGTDAISFNTAGAFGSVGGTNPATDGNTICSQRYGVHVASDGVSILGNSIVSCGGVQGIDLNNGGVVPANDSCDADGGANGWQNYPVITSAAVNGSTTAITGTFDSTGGRTFRLEFFRNFAGTPANGSARDFMGTVNVATTLVPSCATPFSVTLPFAASSLDLITATATDLTSGSTSWLAPQVATSVVAPAISLDVSSLAFSTQLSGTISTAQRITVTNTGSATLNIASVAPPSGYAVVSTCGAPVPPGKTCTLDVDFEAAAAGNFNGNLVITSDAPSTPTVNVSLTGATLNPPTLSIATFASRTPGQVSTVTVNIGNTILNPLAYAGFSVQLDYPAGFVHDTSVAVQTSCAASVTTVGSPTVTGIAATGGSDPPGTTCGVVGSQLFVPTTPGTYTFTILAGGFTISSPFAYSNPSPITATVTVAAAPAPGVSLSPPSLTFASQNVGTSSVSQAVTLTNTGNAPLNVGSIVASGDFSQTNACPATINPGPTNACVFNVTFTPTAAGPRTGTVTVTSDAPGSPHSVGLSGTGIALAPAVSLTPPSLTFASRTVGTTSTLQVITLANTGNGPLSITSITGAGDYAFTSSCGATVAALASCTINVTFTPLAAGPRPGSLVIVDNAPGSPHTVTLSGSGTAGVSAVPGVSPSLLDFEAQAVGSSSPVQLVVVSNTGTGPLGVSSFSVTGEFATAAPPGTTPVPCPATVAPGSACAIGVIFRPAGTNLRQGVLTIATDAGTLSVNVSGIGMVAEPPQLTMPLALDFGSRTIGITGDGLALPMHNTSPYVAAIHELTATGDFDVSDTCATIPAGDSCSLLVTFLPTQVGARTGTLTVRTLRDANPYVVALTGIGIENVLPSIQASPIRVGFGNVFVGGNSSQTVTLRNAGLGPLHVSGILFAGDFFAGASCVGTIQPGASCSLNITFSPMIPGGRQGVMQILSDDPNGELDVSLSGAGCYLPTPSHARAGLPLCGS